MLSYVTRAWDTVFFFSLLVPSLLEINCSFNSLLEKLLNAFVFVSLLMMVRDSELERLVLVRSLCPVPDMEITIRALSY